MILEVLLLIYVWIRKTCLGGKLEHFAWNSLILRSQQNNQVKDELQKATRFVYKYQTLLFPTRGGLWPPRGLNRVGYLLVKIYTDSETGKRHNEELGFNTL